MRPLGKIIQCSCSVTLTIGQCRGHLPVEYQLARQALVLIEF